MEKLGIITSINRPLGGFLLIGGDIIAKQKVIKALADLPSTLTVDEVATVLGISRAKAYELIHAENGCPHWRFGKRIVVPRDEFEAWLRSTLISSVVEHNERLD